MFFSRKKVKTKIAANKVSVQIDIGSTDRDEAIEVLQSVIKELKEVQ